MNKNLGNLLKQAQKMQEKMMKFQEELEQKHYEGQAGGGMVKAVVNGKLVLISIQIDKQVITPDDPDMLQDLVFAAVQSAQEKAAQTMKEEMAKITGGMGINLPGMF